MIGEISQKLCLFLVILGAVNLAAFSVGSAVIGGYAGLGQGEASRYFVAVAGASLPVSRAVFLYSLWHGYSQGLTALPALTGAFFLWNRRFSSGRPLEEASNLAVMRDTWLSCHEN